MLVSISSYVVVIAFAKFKLTPSLPEALQINHYPCWTVNSRRSICMYRVWFACVHSLSAQTLSVMWKEPRPAPIRRTPHTWHSANEGLWSQRGRLLLLDRGVCACSSLGVLPVLVSVLEIVSIDRDWGICSGVVSAIEDFLATWYDLPCTQDIVKGITFYVISKGLQFCITLLT